jgi:uncharacterized protein involved in exopolysaccharide biosynthesis
MKIGRKEISYGELSRQAKSAENNYALYLNKQEEARISDALDRKRIVNAAVAESPTISPFSSGPSRSLCLILVLVFAATVSIGLAIAADYLDPSFRTSEEVEGCLGIPVLASIPKSHRLESSIPAR